MAKGKKAVEALKEADKRHFNQVEKYVKVVDGLYTQAVGLLSALAVRVGLPEDDSTFEFPKSKQREVQKVVKQLAERITSTVLTGEGNEWNAACTKFDNFVETVLNTSKLSRGQLAAYRARNLEALAAFQQRKIEGMNLSERVWKTVQPFKDEVELAIDTATGEGKSAAELSRDVRSCLKDPDKLFRRVRDKYGNLQLSKAAQLYHPGQGVYRSSYKNAMRLTRSEVNMAYRESDHTRWQQLDFVVGIQVQTSNNHTCLGKDGKPHRFTDICDELAGKYPKDFNFIGWHPQCRCFATPILKSLDEVEEEIDEDGNYRDLPSANEVKDMPDNFKQYIADNARRIEGWQSMPYYLKDNTERVVPGLCVVTDGQSHASIVSNRQLAAYLLGKDKHYKDVTLDAKTGGLKATHVAHNFDPIGGKYEKAVQEAGYKDGHAVILGSEFDDRIGHKFTVGMWDGLQFEVMGCESATDNNILRGLKHASSKGTTEIPILCFPNGGYSEDKVLRAIQRYKGLCKNNDDFIDFRRVVCVEDGKVVFNEAYISNREHPLYGHSRKKVREAPVPRYTPRIAKVKQNTETTKTPEQLLAEQREKQQLLETQRIKTPRCEATNNDEAIAYVKKYIADDCNFDFKKVKIEVVNDVLTQMAQRMEQLNIKKFKVCGSPHNAKTTASYDEYDNSFNINWNVLTNTKSIWKKLEKWRAKGIRYDSVADEADIIRSTIDHELGHKLLRQYDMKNEAMKVMGQCGKTVFINGKPFNELADVIGYYGSNSVDEFFAECVATYFGPRRGEMKMTKDLVESMLKKIDGYVIDGEISKADLIKAAAEKRHAARTAEKVAKLKKFAEEHKKQSDALYDEIKETLKEVKGITSVDASRLEKLTSGKEGATAMKSGEKVLASVEKLRKELDAVKVQKAAYDKAIDERGGMMGTDDLYEKSVSLIDIKRSKEKFSSYGTEWKKEYFNDNNGGYNVYHRSHQFSEVKAKNAKMTGGEAEKFVGKLLADIEAKKVEFLPENGKKTGKPDLSFDGYTWDIKYISMANENTIRKYIEDARKADRVIFFWDEDNKLDMLKRAYSRTLGKFKGKGKADKLPDVFYMNKDGKLCRL